MGLWSSNVSNDKLTWMSPWTDTPNVASICGTLMAFLNALCAYYNVIYISFASDWVNISVMCSYLVFMGLFLSYMLFKDKYSSLARESHSPIGNYGAVLWLAIFGMNFIGMVGFQCGENKMPLIIFTVLTLLSTIFYFTILHTWE